MRKYELIAQYFLAQLNAAEIEVQELQRRVRYRRIDINDCFELELALYKLELLQEVNKNIMVFLQMGVKRSVEDDKSSY